jgi:hypothetical protein
LKRVQDVLNSVQNTEESTGKAQHIILKRGQKPGWLSNRRGPWMNTAIIWSNLKNDSRLNPAQKKTINKIVVSLQVPARDKNGNRPALNFNIKSTKFLSARNGQPNIAKINQEVRSRAPKNEPNENTSVFYNAQQQFNNNNKNLAAQMFRQHRQTFGN